MGNWKPRTKPGGIYCSPACGFNCTRRAYDEAHRKSAAIAKRLGRGWEPHVWENCGWHWNVSKGSLSVSSFGLGYLAQFRHKHTVYAATATAAIKRLRRIVDAESKSLQKDIRRSF